MTDIIQTRGGEHLVVRRIGRAGRITMNNPKALNALTYEMSLGLEGAMDAWRTDPAVDLIVVGAAGDRAFDAFQGAFRQAGFHSLQIAGAAIGRRPESCGREV